MTIVDPWPCPTDSPFTQMSGGKGIKEKISKNMYVCMYIYRETDNFVVIEKKGLGEGGGRQRDGEKGGRKETFLGVMGT